MHLIELGCDIDAPERAQAMAGEHSFGSYDPLTPRCLYLAAARGHTDVCKLVVEKGAEVDAICISEELKEIFQFVYFTPLKVGMSLDCCHSPLSRLPSACNPLVMLQAQSVDRHPYPEPCYHAMRHHFFLRGFANDDDSACAGSSRARAC
jgi:hypothetical protein